MERIESEREEAEGREIPHFMSFIKIICVFVSKERVKVPQGIDGERDGEERN